MCSPSPPPAPDYTGAANATASGNLNMARVATKANRPDEYTPLGSRTWKQSGGDGYSWNGGTFSDENSLRNALTNYATENNYAPTDVDKWMGSQEQYGITKGDPDKWESSINLSPEGQKLFDQQMRISQNLGNVGEAGLNRVGDAMSKSFDTSQLPGRVSNVDGGSIQSRLDYSGAPAMPQASEGARSAVVNALMQRQQPAMDRARQAREAALIAQGHTRGGSAWDAQQDDLYRAENDARLAAEIAGGAEQSRLFNMGLGARQQGIGEINNQGQFANAAQAQRFGQGMQNAGLANTGRQNAIQEQAFLRQLPLNELNALRSGSQVGMPQFQAYGQQQTTPGANLSGAAAAQGLYDQNIYNQQVASGNSAMSGLFGMGGLALSGFTGSPLGSSMIGGLLSR